MLRMPGWSDGHDHTGRLERSQRDCRHMPGKEQGQAPAYGRHVESGYAKARTHKAAGVTPAALACRTRSNGTYAALRRSRRPATTRPMPRSDSIPGSGTDTDPDVSVVEVELVVWKPPPLGEKMLKF